MVPLSLERGDEDTHTGAIFSCKLSYCFVWRETHVFKVIDDYPSIFDCKARIRVKQVKKK